MVQVCTCVRALSLRAEIDVRCLPLFISTLLLCKDMFYFVCIMHVCVYVCLCTICVQAAVKARR